MNMHNDAEELLFRPKKPYSEDEEEEPAPKGCKKARKAAPKVPPSPFTATSTSTSPSTNARASASASGTGTTSNRAHASACASATISSGVSANAEASASVAMHSSPRSQLSVAPLCYDSDSEDDTQDCSLLPEMSPHSVHKRPVFSTPSPRTLTLAVPRSTKASVTFSGKFLIFSFSSQRLG